MRRATNPCRLTGLVLCGLCIAGCVTREETPRPRPGLRAAAPGAGVAPLAYEGPVARPVDDPESSASSSVVVEVQPIGSVPYDGQVLPLVSPDGRYLACQTGSPPAWDVLLGGTSPYPLATRIEIFDTASSPIERIFPRDGFPPGLVLGRGSDAEGFLVEGIRVDGSRWIGKVTWGGTLRWLVQGEGIASHAVLSSTGDLAYTRLEGGVGVLVVRGRDGQERVLRRAEGSLVMPTFAGDPRTLYAILVTPDGSLDLVAVRLDPRGDGIDIGPVTSRVRLAARASPAVAYQIMAPTQSPLPRASNRVEAPLIIYHPIFGRMAEFAPRRGEFVLLAEDSIAGVLAPEASTPGYLLTTPEGLTFQARDRRGRIIATPRVLSEAYVPRATTEASRAFILLGPGRQANRLEVAAMRFAPRRP